jgi:hypothetical protein
MFRAALCRCAAALDRVDYLITLTRLGVLDRFAGPMPQGPACPLDEGEAGQPRLSSRAAEQDGRALTKVEDGMKAARAALAAD